jgi:hypothetical protein
MGIDAMAGSTMKNRDVFANDPLTTTPETVELLRDQAKLLAELADRVDRLEAVVLRLHDLPPG